MGRDRRDPLDLSASCPALAGLAGAACRRCRGIGPAPLAAIGRHRARWRASSTVTGAAIKPSSSPSSTSPRPRSAPASAINRMNGAAAPSCAARWARLSADSNLRRPSTIATGRSGALPRASSASAASPSPTQRISAFHTASSSATSLANQRPRSRSAPRGPPGRGPARPCSLQLPTSPSPSADGAAGRPLDRQRAAHHSDQAPRQPQRQAPPRSRQFPRRGRRRPRSAGAAVTRCASAAAAPSSILIVPASAAATLSPARPPRTRGKRPGMTAQPTGSCGSTRQRSAICFSAAGACSGIRLARTSARRSKLSTGASNCTGFERRKIENVGDQRLPRGRCRARRRTAQAHRRSAADVAAGRSARRPPRPVPLPCARIVAGDQRRQYGQRAQEPRGQDGLLPPDFRRHHDAAKPATEASAVPSNALATEAPAGVENRHQIERVPAGSRASAEMQKRRKQHDIQRHRSEAPPRRRGRPQDHVRAARPRRRPAPMPQPAHRARRTPRPGSTRRAPAHSKTPAYRRRPAIPPARLRSRAAPRAQRRSAAIRTSPPAARPPRAPAISNAAIARRRAACPTACPIAASAVTAIGDAAATIARPTAAATTCQPASPRAPG